LVALDIVKENLLLRGERNSGKENEKALARARGLFRILWFVFLSEKNKSNE